MGMAGKMEGNRLRGRVIGLAEHEGGKEDANFLIGETTWVGMPSLRWGRWRRTDLGKYKEFRLRYVNLEMLVRDILEMIRNVSQRRDLAEYVSHVYVNCIYSHEDGHKHLPRGCQVRKTPKCSRNNRSDAQKRGGQERSQWDGKAGVGDVEAAQGRACSQKKELLGMPVKWGLRGNHSNRKRSDE